MRSRRSTFSPDRPRKSYPRFRPGRNRWWRWFRRGCWRLSHLAGEPDYLARGLALGVFAGWFPFFGLQIAFGIGLASLFRGHPLLAAAGTWVSNPLTYVPIYLFNYQVGLWLLGAPAIPFDLNQLLAAERIWDLGLDFAAALLLGCCVVGIVCALVAYFLSFKLICRWRQQQLRIHLEIQPLHSNPPPDHLKFPPPPAQK
ncbi:MAG: DUF2062 domain-containing protein [Oscillatoriales cyanobacterium RM1_1_9]|nr:DUF2062 domain-containing protein [Oscillatoriales cyanobacterium SM2_3_0]NJO45035.1 DUF2062 domain-containing protein [Oscillatoriales cyanobacterium RM2_1_1]NJO71489.1 DUF2062 domain-containing protein [Oscillatoriales cyanobacterium RM1_1_9]